MNCPAVSVIVPAYNAAAFLPRTLESVLTQSMPDFELIIVDDGSTDGTPELVAPSLSDSRVRYFRQSNQGVSAARNQGARVASGEFLALCDADDLWAADKLALQLEAFNDAPDTGLVYCNISTIDEHDQLIREKSNRYTCYSGRVTKQLILRNFVPAPGVMMRRDCFEQCGGFAEELSLAEDYDLWLRLSTICEFRHIPKSLVKYRRHATQATNTRQEEIFLAHIGVIEKFGQAHPELAPRRLVSRGLAETRKNLGHYYLKDLGDKQRARASFRSAISLSPLYLSAWNRLLKSYFQAE